MIVQSLKDVPPNAAYARVLPNGTWEVLDAVPGATLTLAQVKAAKRREVTDRAKDVQDAFLASQGYSAGEASTWPIKRAEAMQATPTASNCPLLNAEAIASGRTLASVVARVNANAAAFSAFSVQCAGNRAKHHDAIDALTTAQQVADYDYSAGWP